MGILNGKVAYKQVADDLGLLVPLDAIRLADRASTTGQPS